MGSQRTSFAPCAFWIPTMFLTTNLVAISRRCCLMSPCDRNVTVAPSLSPLCQGRNTYFALLMPSGHLSASQTSYSHALMLTPRVLAHEHNAWSSTVTSQAEAGELMQGGVDKEHRARRGCRLRRTVFHHRPGRHQGRQPRHPGQRGNGST